MPIYEYVCFDCRKRVSVFFRSIRAAEQETPRCPECNGERIRRLVSRVAVMKSESRRMDDMADPAVMAGLEQEDPRALARFMRQMSDEMGEPLDAEMTEVLDRLESGEDPDAIDAALADMDREFGDDFSGDDFSGAGDFGGMDTAGGSLPSLPKA